MKINHLIVASLATGLMATACTDTCEQYSEYTYFKPVYTSMATIRSSVSFDAPKEISGSGKIYLINDHLLINEPGNGIHILDNTDPKNPQNLGFLSIPGNYDMAAVDGYLYADSYVDLVVFDIEDFTTPTEVDRLEAVFNAYNIYGFNMTDQGVVTDWIEVTETSETPGPCSDGIYYYDNINFVYSDGVAISNESSGASASSAGLGGSMAKFTISQNHLYMMDAYALYIADISTPANPLLGNSENISWGIETIFPYGNMLFLGSNSGMFIYSIEEPQYPTLVSTYSHITSCDPVVTDGRYAYVTLRSGTDCQGYTNQLDVIDIQDPASPALLETYSMYNPHGLSISGGQLYVCDGDAGLKIYDASDIHHIDDNLIKSYSDVNAYDVIVNDCLIMLIGEDGLKQYQCSEIPGQIQYLSTVSF